MFVYNLSDNVNPKTANLEINMLFEIVVDGHEMSAHEVGCVWAQRFHVHLHSDWLKSTGLSQNNDYTSRVKNSWSILGRT